LTIGTCIAGTLLNNKYRYSGVFLATAAKLWTVTQFQDKLQYQ